MFRDIFNPFAKLANVFHNLKEMQVDDVNEMRGSSRGKSGRRFTTKPSGAAALKRAAKKSNNIRKRSKK